MNLGRGPLSRRRFLAAAGLASALALTGCGGGEAKGADEKSVALVTPQKAGDGGPTDNLVSGLATLKAAGYSTRHVAAPDPSSHESTLRNLAQSGTPVIVVSFSDFTQVLKTVAPDFPKTKFVHIYSDPYKPEMPNVQTVSFDTQGPSYLAGVLAATVSKTGVIGFIGGTAIPSLYADYHAFEAGAKATRADIVLKSAFVGSFGDPVKGQQIAQTMFNNKVDVVLAYAGGSSVGVVKAADQAKTHVIYDNVESDQTAGSVIAIASQHYGGTMAKRVRGIDDGSWKPGGTVAGLADDGTFLDRAKKFRAEAGAPDLDSAFKKVDETKQKIVDGSIDVPFDTDPV
ncbi:BMP family ABC transporter substrate-binding protein [Actinomadura livida]|uniref:BMP family ABC transporter substrate-binding protein n=1 Tax=Actinomadura livida TaxID=79909 RepID=A0A7W7MV69_9ACTN|nr:MULTISPECIES: BMP family ABC transporter substrate-binding protein [Actinomadura]MBB4772311.1 basic membrane protein A [Actinomadura catellatispora]GGU28445.1 lipoprotein [Actinomadura livida]